MNANQLNALFRRQGLKVRLCSCQTYYIWLDANGALIADAPSVYVHRASQLPTNRWLEEARAVHALLVGGAA